MRLGRITGVLAGAGVVALAAWGALGVYRQLDPHVAEPVPVTRVKRGDVVFSVTSNGYLQGGNSKMMTAPTTGSRELVLTSLRRPGELVAEGEIVAQFDSTEETYKLREAEADLAEAEQQVIQAQNEALAKEEELNYDMLKARADVELAEIEVKRNELLAAISAKQNDLALAAARERFQKLERDYPERKAAAKASIAIQEAARKKAAVQADTARRNIDLMILKAPAPGYVNVERNTNSNFFYPGMQFPLYQVGDQVRPGMAVAQIPDLKSWEAAAQISEQDRGHISVGQPAAFEIVALPGRKFRGKVTNLGGITGPPWNRRFECKLSLEDPAPELRPGMSARIVITTQTLSAALWIPAQALFESDGRTFVHTRGDGGFTAKDVKLIRKSESQVVVEGLGEGQEVALASPEQKGQAAQKKGPTPAGNAAKAVAK